jgi:tetratricopeptide (TPR) repeat protein
MGAGMSEALLQTPDELFQAGMAHHRAGRLSEAVAAYDALLQADPGHADGYHLLGLAAYQLGQYEQAHVLIRHALDLRPDVALYQNSLGTVLSALGQPAAALAAFRQAQTMGRASEAAAADRRVLQPYQDKVDQLRQSPYMDYPAHVHLETMSLCNAACTFCPYPTLERQGTTMPLELIEKVIDDLTAIPPTLPFQLSPFKVNEPFLDKRLFYILDLCNDKLPNACLTLTTNASPLTEKKLDQLAAVKNLGYLWVSLNDHRPEVYEATMKLPWPRTFERLQLLARKQAAGQLPFRVVLSRVGDGSAADAAFCDWVREHFPACEPSVFPRGSWLGQVDTPVGQVPAVGCTRWFDVSITSTGVVAHCCMDGQAQWPLGDINRQHVLEIYNAPHYRRLRQQAVTRAEVEPCNRCTFL